MSTLLTEEQINQIATVFGLKKLKTYPVRDGVVAIGDKVWWRCETGPEFVDVHGHLHNIIEFPNAYSIEKPKVKITYEDTKA